MYRDTFINAKVGEITGWHDGYGNYNQLTRVPGGAMLEFFTNGKELTCHYIPLSEIMAEPNGRDIDAAR